MLERSHPPAILPPREVDSANEHKSSEEEIFETNFGTATTTTTTTTAAAAPPSPSPTTTTTTASPLPHQSSVRWRVNGVPMIPRPPETTPPPPPAAASRPRPRPPRSRASSTPVPAPLVVDPTEPAVYAPLTEPIRSDDGRRPRRRLLRWSPRPAGAAPPNKGSVVFANRSLWRRSASSPLSRSVEVAFPPSSPSGEDWKEYWDEEVEASYYYNIATGEASWVNPRESA